MELIIQNVLWVVTSSIILGGYQCFGGICCHIFNPNDRGRIYLLSAYNTIRCHKTKNRDLQLAASVNEFISYYGLPTLNICKRYLL
jgi:hypothetical protein